MSEAVHITFDCLPLRSIGRLDVPIDASPAYRVRCEKLKRAIEAHGTSRAYFLHNAQCVFHLANSEVDGMARFCIEGTVLTDASDAKTVDARLEVELVGQTCGQLPPPVKSWFQDQVRQAVKIEFDRYIASGGLAANLERIEHLKDQGDDPFVGMYL